MRRLPRATVWTVFALLAFMLTGCGHEALPPSGPHDPVVPTAVKIYQDYPRKYELLGTITLPITPEYAWNSRGRADAAVANLRGQAGAMGGNGLLLMIDPEKFDYLQIAGVGKREWYRIPIRMNPDTAVADVIYVLKE